MKRFGFLLCLMLSLPGLAWAQRVALDTTMGTIVIELAPKEAPKTVANFLEYVKSGHYNTTVQKGDSDMPSMWLLVVVVAGLLAAFWAFGWLSF